MWDMPAKFQQRAPKNKEMDSDWRVSQVRSSERWHLKRRPDRCGKGRDGNGKGNTDRGKCVSPVWGIPGSLLWLH